MNSLKIFKSSAGSGKTFTLVKEYLKLALTHPDDFKSILAITFTNKAAEEMKSRIIETLVSLSDGEDSGMKKVLSTELPGIELQINGSKCLKNILHDYSSFSVSTIDSFFHRILRSLAREIHLPLNMEVQINTEDAVLEVTDRLLKEVGVDKELTDWLTNLAMQKMDDEKGWHIDLDLRLVVEQLIKQDDTETATLTRAEIKVLYEKLIGLRNAFEKQMSLIGKKAMTAIDNSGFSLEDFSYGKSGVANYFYKIAEEYCPDYNIKGRTADALESAEKWIKKTHEEKDRLVALVSGQLLPLLQDANSYLTSNQRSYITANEILRKIYLFGIVNDMQKKLSEYRHENNVILLADTTRMLSKVIEGSDSPFVYEKAGNRYKHLLIDEFQDTSLLQWKNLLPLVINALGSGFMTLIVGDAKQSIYRWRGGNMNLLIRDVFTDLHDFKTITTEEVLSTNYRSKKEVVEFNNAFFEQATKVVNNEIQLGEHASLNLAYGNDLKQNIAPHHTEGGFVHVEFLADEEENEEEENAGWKDVAKNKMLTEIKTLLSIGYTYRNICILVRKKTEGNDIATFLLENDIDKIISPDSLLITSSPKIGFLINIFRYITDTRNTIARSEVVYYYGRFLSKQENRVNHYHQLFADHKFAGRRRKTEGKNQTLFESDGLKDNLFNQLLPQEFTANVSALSRLPVFELSEQLIRIFNLNENPDAYIQRFQDLVLEYSASMDSSPDGFIRWWDGSSKVQNCSVIIPANENAIRIMTIHRSKGLQFPIVIMPFTEWSLLPKANEIVWMRASEKPFDEFGKVALQSSNKLLESHFQEAYEKEITETVIDNMNLLYVAFTRAEEKLFIYTPADTGKDLNKVSKLINRACSKIFNSEENIFTKGKNDKKISIGKENNETGETLRSYPSNPWQAKLALSSHAGDLLEIVGDKKQKSVHYGKLVHSILADLNKTEDLQLILDKLFFNGIIGKEESEALFLTVSDVLSAPEIAPFFEEGKTVIREKNILIPDGTVLRPDRVIIKDNKATIIDFKTGKPDKKHEAQLRGYASVLKSMHYQAIKSYLIYLQEKSVVEVL